MITGRGRRVRVPWMIAAALPALAFSPPAAAADVGGKKTEFGNTISARRLGGC